MNTCAQVVTPPGDKIEKSGASSQSCSSHRRSNVAQRLIQVGNDVVRMLQTHAEPQQSVRDADCEPVFARYDRVCYRSGMLDYPLGFEVASLTRQSATRPATDSAEEKIRVALPISSISTPNSKGAAA